MNILVLIATLLATQTFANTSSDFERAKTALIKFQQLCRATPSELTVRRYQPTQIRIRELKYRMLEKASNIAEIDCTSERNITSSPTLSLKRLTRYLESQEPAALCFQAKLADIEKRTIFKLLNKENILISASSTPGSKNLSDLCHYHDFNFYLKSRIYIKFSFFTEKPIESAL